MSAPPLPMSPRNLTPGAMYSGWLRVSNAYNGTFITCSRMTITKGLCRRIPFEERWGDLIDAFVGALRRENRRHQKFKGLGYTSAQSERVGECDRNLGPFEPESSRWLD